MADVFDSPTSPSSVGRFPAVGISLVLCLKILISLVISVECVTKVEIVAVSLPVKSGMGGTIRNGLGSSPPLTLRGVNCRLRMLVMLVRHESLFPFILNCLIKIRCWKPLLFLLCLALVLILISALEARLPLMVSNLSGSNESDARPNLGLGIDSTPGKLDARPFLDRALESAVAVSKPIKFSFSVNNK